VTASITPIDSETPRLVVATISRLALDAGDGDTALWRAWSRALELWFQRLVEGVTATTGSTIRVAPAGPKDPKH
jgi:hypothetical protein